MDEAKKSQFKAIKVLLPFTNLDDVFEKCPACEKNQITNDVRFLYINLDEQILKCSSSNCFYPFRNFIFKNVKEKTYYRYEQIPEPNLKPNHNLLRSPEIKVTISCMDDNYPNTSYELFSPELPSNQYVLNESVCNMDDEKDDANQSHFDFDSFVNLELSKTESGMGDVLDDNDFVNELLKEITQSPKRVPQPPETLNPNIAIKMETCQVNATKKKPPVRLEKYLNKFGVTKSTQPKMYTKNRDIKLERFLKKSQVKIKDGSSESRTQVKSESLTSFKILNNSSSKRPLSLVKTINYKYNGHFTKK